MSRWAIFRFWSSSRMSSILLMKLLISWTVKSCSCFLRRLMYSSRFISYFYMKMRMVLCSLRYSFSFPSSSRRRGVYCHPILALKMQAPRMGTSPGVLASRWLIFLRTAMVFYL